MDIDYHFSSKKHHISESMHKKREGHVFKIIPELNFLTIKMEGAEAVTKFESK